MKRYAVIDNTRQVQSIIREYYVIFGIKILIRRRVFYVD